MMKTILKIIGILMVIFSSIHLIFCFMMINMSKSYGIETKSSIAFIPVFTIIIGIILIVMSNKTISDKDYKEYKVYKEQRERIYYDHKDYECKRYDEYLMSPQERLNKIYSELPSTEQQKIVQYAESVYKRHESERYR